MDRMQHFEDRMQTPSFFWLINLFLAIVIYYNAELGRLMGIQGIPLAISVVWPATGFSLAALLLFGYSAWPGILLGNFVYNFLHLFSGVTFFGPLITSAVISLASLGEALLGFYIMRTYSTSHYFFTIKDIVIFLLPVGLMTSLFASFVGTLALFFYGGLSVSNAAYTGLNFWVGDCMGIYIFTPLLIVWSITKLNIPFKLYINELTLMILSFIGLALLSIGFNQPVAHLFIPLCLWIGYYFRMHGVTIALFIIVLIVTISTSLGFGFSIIFAYPANTLLITIVFLEIIVATSLLFAAAINERDAYKNLLQNRNIDFQHIFDLLEEKKEKQ